MQEDKEVESPRGSQLSMLRKQPNFGKIPRNKVM